jgi:hypothetical protein
VKYDRLVSEDETGDRLERELVERPDDLGVLGVYADHLAATGDTGWSTWIALHLARERAETRSERDRLTAEIVAHRAQLFANELHPHLETSRAHESHGGRLLLDCMTIPFAVLNLDGSAAGIDLALLEALLANRASRFLRKLHLRVWDHPGAPGDADHILGVVARTSLPALADFRLEIRASPEFEVALATRLALYAQAPRLILIAVAWGDARRGYFRDIDGAAP